MEVVAVEQTFLAPRFVLLKFELGTIRNCRSAKNWGYGEETRDDFLKPELARGEAAQFSPICFQIEPSKSAMDE